MSAPTAPADDAAYQALSVGAQRIAGVLLGCAAAGLVIGTALDLMLL